MRVSENEREETCGTDFCRTRTRSRERHTGLTPVVVAQTPKISSMGLPPGSQGVTEAVDSLEMPAGIESATCMKVAVGLDQTDGDSASPPVEQLLGPPTTLVSSDDLVDARDWKFCLESVRNWTKDSERNPAAAIEEERFPPGWGMNLL